MSIEERELAEVEDCARKGIAFPAGAVRMVAEIRRLDHLHRLDHSLADQWQKRAEGLADALAKVKAAIEANATDTLWMPNALNLTVCEFIELEIKRGIP